MEDVMMTAAAQKKRVRGERQRLQDVQWRQRKKHEREHLEETAQQLETQLNQLKQDKGRLCSFTPSISKAKDNRNEVKWQERAEKMKQERFRAELLNLTLRRAVACELRVAKSLRAAMHKRPHVTPKVMAHVHRGGCLETVATQVQHSPCLQCCNPTTRHLNPTAVRREIDATLLRARQQAVDVLNSSATNDSLSFHCNVRLDPVAGPTTEVSVTTPVNCAVKDAVKLLGPKLNARSHDGAMGPRCIPEPRRTGGLPKERQFTVELGAPHQTVLLDGFGSTREIDDGCRRLIMWAALLFDRCGVLCFRECTWLAVYQSPSDPANESMVRIQYSVAAEKTGGCTVIDGENIDKVRDRALGAMGKQIKERYLAMQREILLQTGRGDLISFVGP